MLPTPSNAAEEKALSDIERYGLHIINILEDQQNPGFSYSVGLWHSYQHAEVIISGLCHDLSQWMLNEIAHRIKDDGERFEDGRHYSGLLEGFDCHFCNVPRSQFSAHVGWDLWFYGDLHFELVQCIWPTTDGHFPWETGASEAFRTQQFILKDQA